MTETATNVSPPPDLTYGYVDGRIALSTWPAESISDGGWFTTFVTATWLGANPGALVWQVRPRVGIASLQVNTRYSKGLN